MNRSTDTQGAAHVAAASTVAPAAAGTSVVWSVLPVVLLVAWALVEFVSLARSVAAGAPGAWSHASTAAVVLVAATVSSVAGFAFAALAGIGLAFIATDPVHAVHTIVLCSIATQVYAVWQLRKSVQWPVLLPMLVGGALTVPCGVWFCCTLRQRRIGSASVHFLSHTAHFRSAVPRIGS